MERDSENAWIFEHLPEISPTVAVPGTPTPGGLPPDNDPISTRPQFDPGILEQLNKLVLKASNPKAKNFIQENAWACMHCESRTVNGLSGHRLQVRKSCKKCARPRTVELSVMEGFLAFELSNRLLS